MAERLIAWTVHCAFRIAVVFPLLVGTASHSVAEEVRVLLHEAPEAVRIEPVDGAGQPHALSLDASGGLMVRAGGSIERVGHAGVWSSRGSGPWRVGSGPASERRVRGRLEAWSQNGQIQVLNRVDLEDYVASTVGGEMISGWPIEALRAQAVAARTYVLHEASKRSEASWDVRATEVSQVYRGLSAETARTRSATRSTSGQILLHEGEPILAVFHSTAGGRTAGAGEVWGRDLPYLREVVVDGEEEAPHTYWRAPRERVEVETQVTTMGLNLGRLREIDIASRTPSGRVARLKLAGSRSSVSLSGIPLRQFAAALGLRSTLFDVNQTEAGFTFVGSGYGHGVGMSQWGARAMAMRGAGYRQILETFYPGAALAQSLALQSGHGAAAETRVGLASAHPEPRGDR